MLGFDKTELKLLRQLKTPDKIQDYLESIPYNFERSGETCFSPRLVMRYRKAHCMEGALFAAAALSLHGHKPLILDLRAHKNDLDHVIALFKKDGKWGAISKTNHVVLSFREPVYTSVRELVMSYFHEYFLNNGKKTLRSFSRPLNLECFDKQNWATSEKNLWYIDRYLARMPHQAILTAKQIQDLRLADPIEIKAGQLTRWKKRGPNNFP